MENTTKLRNELKIVFEDLKSKKIDVQSAKTIVGVSNAMLKSAALEMEHSRMTGQKREIAFLKTPIEDNHKPYSKGD